MNHFSLTVKGLQCHCNKVSSNIGWLTMGFNGFPVEGYGTVCEVS